MAISLLQMLIVLGALSSALSQLTIQLPALTGKYSLGTVALEVISPSTGRDLMTSFFYPMDSSCSEYPFSPVFPPLTLAYLLESVGISPNLPVNITTQAHLGAPISSTSFPLLFFSPGYGGSRLLYQAAAEDLASLGYIVILVDHPLDCSFIEYPDGRVSEANPINYESYDAYIPFVNARVQDIQSVLQVLSNKTFLSQIPGLARGDGAQHKDSKYHFPTSKVGVLGHSLGGATAASTILASPRQFTAGLNLDGAIIGNVTTLGLSAPFMLISSSVHNRTNDATWASFWSNLRGYKREIGVKGTYHQAFSDYVVLADDLLAAGLFNETFIFEEFGTVNGTRMLEIESAYVGAFFDKWLKGDNAGDALLNGPSVLFPEIEFDD